MRCEEGGETGREEPARRVDDGVIAFHCPKSLPAQGAARWGRTKLSRNCGALTRKRSVSKQRLTVDALESRHTCQESRVARAVIERRWPNAASTYAKLRWYDLTSIIERAKSPQPNSLYNIEKFFDNIVRQQTTTSFRDLYHEARRVTEYLKIEGNITRMALILYVVVPY